MININIPQLNNPTTAATAALLATMAGTTAAVGITATAANLPGYWWLGGAGLSMLLPAAVLAGNEYYNQYLKLDDAALEKKRELAATKQAEKELQKEHDKYIATVKKEALFLAKCMPDFLAKQSRMERYYNNPIDQPQRRRRRQLISFSHIVINEPHEVWFRFDGRRLPFGTAFWDLVNRGEEIEANLTHSIRREVKLFHSERNYDIWLIVALNSAYRGIPNKLAWATAIDRMQTKKFMIPVGVNRYGKLISVDFRRLPHLLVLGATGNGKSTWLNQAIATLVQHHDPKWLQLYMVDMKKGVELYPWRNIPHLNSFVTEPDQVISSLANLVDVMNERYNTIRNGGYRDIDGYNATEPEPLPYMIYIIDELATITLDQSIKKQALELLSSLARLGRAAGFHLLMCTQVVDKTVLDRQILGNIAPRICFAVPSDVESRLAIGLGMAKDIKLKGRAIFRYNGKFQEIQAPYASDEELAAVINKITESNGAITEINTWEVDLLDFIFNNANRELTTTAYEMVESLTQYKLKQFIKQNTYDIERQNFVVYQGAKYILSPGRTATGMSVRRIMIPWEGDQPPILTEKALYDFCDRYQAGRRS